MTKDEGRIGTGSDEMVVEMAVTMAMKMTARGVAEVAVRWVHLMTATMIERMALRVVLRWVGLTGG